MLEKINYIFTRKQKIQMMGFFFLTIIAGLLEMLGVSAILPFVSVILMPEVVETNRFCAFLAKIFSLDTPEKFIIFMIFVLIVIYIVKNVFLILEYVAQLKFTYGCNENINFRLMHCYINQDYLFHVNHNVADLQRNVGGDVTIFFNMVQAFLNLLLEIVTTGMILVYLLWLDAFTTLMIVFFLAISLGVIYKVFKKYQIKQGELSRKITRKHTKWLLQTFGGIKEIKAGNREDFFYQQYIDAYDKEIRIGMRSSILSRTPKYVMETFCVSVMLIVLGIRLSMGVEMVTFSATISSFAFAAVRLLPSFNRITEYLGIIFYAQASTDNIYRDLQNEKELQKSLINIIEEKEKIRFNKKIELKNICFKYPNGERDILKNASIEICKNQSIAFIGPSGAGKTTLVDMLLGLIKPSKGEILVDGINLDKYVYAWHKAIGYIPQAIYLIDDTIRANIVFGYQDDNEEFVWECLKRAHLDEFVKSLPNGIDTTIGEAGARLSGGQRQRIGIARALYSRPDILILDEATSALDNDTEYAVMQSIERLHGNMTLIIIAHRLSTISQCDRVYEINNGSIIERDKDEVLNNKQKI